MNTFLNSKTTIRLIYFIEIALLAICFLLLSSKITFIPWHTKLTTYVLLHLLSLVVVQFALFLTYWSFSERQIQYLKLRRISLIHLFILLSMSLLSILSIQYFTLGCIIFSIMSLYLMYITIKYLQLHIKTINQEP